MVNQLGHRWKHEEKQIKQKIPGISWTQRSFSFLFFFSNMVNRQDVASTALLSPPLIIQERSGHSSSRLRHGCKNQVMTNSAVLQVVCDSLLLSYFCKSINSVQTVLQKKKKKASPKVHCELPSLFLKSWFPSRAPRSRPHHDDFLFHNNMPALCFSCVLFFY